MGTKSTDLPFFIAAQYRCGFHYLIACVINSKQFPHIGEGLPTPDCSDGQLIAYFDSITAEFKDFEEDM